MAVWSIQCLTLTSRGTTQYLLAGQVRQQSPIPGVEGLVGLTGKPKPRTLIQSARDSRSLLRVRILKGCYHAFLQISY